MNKKPNNIALGAFVLAILFGIIGMLLGYGSEGTFQAACKGAGVGMVIAMVLFFIAFLDGE